MGDDGAAADLAPAPRIRRPLALWNPLDYVRLFCWSWFFPQALRVYAEQCFPQDLARDASWEQRQRPGPGEALRRRLALQAALLLVAIFFALGGAHLLLRLPFYWPGIGAGVAFGLVRGVLKALRRGVTHGVAFGVAVGTATGLAGALVFTVEPKLAGAIAVGSSLGLAFGVAEVVARGIAGQFAEGLFFGAGVGISVGLGGGLLIGAFTPFGAAAGLAGGAAFGIVVLLAALRPLEWLAGLPFARFGLPAICRLTVLPFPGLRRRLGEELRRDWRAGLATADGLLRHSLQFLPVAAAVNEALASSAADLLPRVALLAELEGDRRLLRYGSASLPREIAAAAREGLLVLPARRPRGGGARSELRYDTPARCACAGFFHLHEQRPAAAAQAFARIRDLPHGRELEWLCLALAAAQKIDDADELADWIPLAARLDPPPEEKLRHEALALLDQLRGAAAEIAAAQSSTAAANRSAAIGRAAATLQHLVQAAERPSPEGRLVAGIAGQWLPLVIELGGHTGTAMIRSPVANPYVGYSGRPVEGATFVGRAGVLSRLERLWSGEGPWTAVFLYGHRRMGKTSLLRNLQKSLKPGTLVVQLDMQGAGYVDHSGQLFYEFARAIHRKAAGARLDAGEPPALADYDTLGAGRIRLDALLERLEPQLAGRILVLAVDEFEVVQERIDKGAIDPDFLTYLRSANQRFRFVALIFSGLHRLGEMGIHYRTAFYGQAEHVRVDYLKKEDALRLITQPSPDFDLEYAPELCEELYRRTFGQPYLLQRLCWELVDAWNDRFLAGGEKTPRRLALADLARLDEEAFFQATHYYFDGVWSNRTPAEQQLLRRLAASGGPLAREACDAAGDSAVVEGLERHDVILEQGGNIDFAAALLRDWVAHHHPLTS